MLIFVTGAVCTDSAYLLVLSPLMPESCPIMKCNTQGFLLSQQLFLTMPSHSQLISSLFKLYISI